MKKSEMLAKARRWMDESKASNVDGTNHGGARDGSGRPHKGPFEVRLTLPLTHEQARYVEQQAPTRATADNPKPTSQDYIRWLIDISKG